MKRILSLSIIAILSVVLSSCSGQSTKVKPCKEPSKCYQLGLEKFSTLNKSKSPQEASAIFQEAALLFQTGCDLQSAESCFELARYHKAQHNIGVSLALFNQACQLGHKKACNQALQEKNK
jgi:TPR repeat protein